MHNKGICLTIDPLFLCSYDVRVGARDTFTIKFWVAARATPTFFFFAFLF